MTQKENQAAQSAFGGVLIRKSLVDEKRLAMFVVLEPQPEDMTTTDLHLDWYTADEIEKACHSFNTFCRKANILHEFETDSYSFAESYIAPCDMEIGDVMVKKGTWLAVIKAEDDIIWNGIKDGTFDGLSIQCVVEYEDIT